MQGGSLISEFNEQTRTLTFEYHDGSDLLDDDLTLEYKDFTITVLATVGIDSMLTNKAPF